MIFTLLPGSLKSAAAEAVWKVGILPLIINIESITSDDYDVIAYTEAAVLGQLQYYPFRILDDIESDYISHRTVFTSLLRLENDRLKKALSVSKDFLQNKEVLSISEIDKSEISDTLYDSGTRIPVSAASLEVESDVFSVQNISSTALRTAALQKGLDSILFFEIEKIRSVYILHALEYTFADEQVSKLGEITFTKKNVQTLNEYLLDIAAEGIGGFTRCELVLDEGLKDDVYVRIGNQQFSAGDIELRVLPAGLFEFEIISRNNYYSEFFSIILEPGEKHLLRIDFPAMESRLLSIISYPYDVIISDDASIANQRSPVLMEWRPVSDKLMIAGKSGYINKDFTLPETYPSEFTQQIRLVPGWLEFDTEIDLGQKAFYRSLAGFLVTIPATVLLNGMAAAGGSPVINTALGFSLSLNVAMVLDTIMSLVDYYVRTDVR
ncbi:MAG: hypothetical protein K9L21_01320 [Spirochaetia bacterium]|nr:hypothetical protein [Spirochaetia bacterium]